MHLIVLLGATSSGKSDLAVDLAKVLGKTVIVNCDSRQIYKNLNLATGKVEGSWQNLKKSKNQRIYLYRDIPHFLIDYVDPTTRHSLANYLADFVSLIKILNSGLDLPILSDYIGANKPEYIILTGGTGMYAKAIYNKLKIPLVRDMYVERYESLKKTLEQKGLQELQYLYKEELSKDYDSQYHIPKLNNSDFQNSRRLTNHLLNIHGYKQDWFKQIEYPRFESIQKFIIQVDKESLRKKIQTRLIKRLENGLLEEVKKFQFLGFKRLYDLGLEYRLGSLYLRGQLNYSEFLQRVVQENYRYAKRQITWLKRELKSDPDNFRKVVDLADLLKKLNKG